MMPGRAPGFRTALDPILPLDSSTRFSHLILDAHSVREFFESFRSILAKFYNGAGAMLLFFIPPAAYGGVHLAAWGFEFPTRGEMWAWRVSSLWIAGFVLYLLGIGVMNTLLGIMSVMVRSTLGLKTLGSTTRHLVGILYNVPIGVYWTPAWLQMISHV